MSSDDRRRAAPLQVDVAGEAEPDGAGLEVELGRRVHQVADVGELLGADEGDEIDGIDQAQLGGHLLDAVGQRLLALAACSSCPALCMPIALYPAGLGPSLRRENRKNTISATAL